MPLSGRLSLTRFIDKSRRPQKYMLEKVDGRRARLSGDDALNWISFRKPSKEFQDFLLPQPYDRRIYEGGYKWGWVSDGSMIFADLDFSFYLTKIEADALRNILSQDSKIHLKENVNGDS
jgi:hypothetical protein